MCPSDKFCEVKPEDKATNIMYSLHDVHELNKCMGILETLDTFLFISYEFYVAGSQPNLRRVDIPTLSDKNIVNTQNLREGV